MQTRAKEANVELAFKPAADLPEMLFDPELLHRAVLNVVTNAIDACEKIEPGRVAVSTSYAPEKQRISITVLDNGEGIAPEDLKKIFSIFESRKGARGTGLGLAVSQKIVREHGGEIQVSSTLGAGSRFTLEIPAVLPTTSMTRDTLATMSQAELAE